MQSKSDQYGTGTVELSLYSFFFFYRQRILYSGGPGLQMEHRGWQGWIRNSQVIGYSTVPYRTTAGGI
jgi:hypothetical protein